MIKSLILNPISGLLDFVSNVPELTADPPNPAPGDMWVLRTISSSAPDGQPYGMLVSLTQPGASTYQLCYRTLEGSTIRVTMS